MYCVLRKLSEKHLLKFGFGVNKMTKQTESKKPYGLEISETAQMFQAIVEMGEVGILVLDEDNRIEFANSMVFHITGYEASTLPGRKFTDFLGEENRKIFQSLKKNAVQVQQNSAAKQRLSVLLPNQWSRKCVLPATRLLVH